MALEETEGDGELTPKQRRFVQEYLVDLNATQAAIRAGYSRSTARSIGQENLTKPAVSEAVKAALEDRARRIAVSSDRVLAELASIAFADIGEVIRVKDDGSIQVLPLDEIPLEARRAIGEITQNSTERFDPEHGSTVEKVRLSVKHHSKVKALELLMNHLGMNAPQKVEHSGEVSLTSAKEALTGKLDELRQRVAAKPSGEAGS